MINNFNDEDYQLSSNTEIDMLLTDLPFGLIKENLKFQINNPLSTNVNYVENVLDKFRILKDEYGDDVDALNSINSMMVEFFGFIIKEIDRKFDLGIDTLSVESSGNIEEVAMALYNFLILRYKKNITKFVYKFIVKNKKLLVEEFEGRFKKKDVTTIAVKKKIKNKDDVLIISSLPSIIKYIMNLDIEPIDFIRYACNDDYYEGFIVRTLIANGSMIGNFLPKYLGLVVDQYDYVLDEIQSDIKLKLMKKL